MAGRAINYKMVPMLMLMSMFFMITTIPICIYYISKCLYLHTDSIDRKVLFGTLSTLHLLKCNFAPVLAGHGGRVVSASDC